MNDYISLDVTGTVTSDPIKSGNGYSFNIENKREKSQLEFIVIVKNDDRPFDFMVGDRVFIAKAGFFMRKNKCCLVVYEGSHIDVIRKRLNHGIVEV